MPHEVESKEKTNGDEFNEHEIFWFIADILTSVSPHLGKHLLNAFLVDLEGKFIFSCQNLTHADFSLMRAWKVISKMRSQEPGFYSQRKPEIL